MQTNILQFSKRATFFTKQTHTNKSWSTHDYIQISNTKHTQNAGRQETWKHTYIHIHTISYLHGMNFFKQSLCSSLVFQQCIFGTPAKDTL